MLAWLKEQPPTFQVSFWIALLAFVWGGVPALAKMAAGNLNGFEMTLWTNLFAVIMIIVLVIRYRVWKTVKYIVREELLKLVVIGFLGNLLFQILYFSSFKQISAIQGSILARFGDAVFIFLAWRYLDEKVTSRHLQAAVFAFSGAIIVGLNPANPENKHAFTITIGFGLIIIGTILEAIYNTLNRELADNKRDRLADLLIYKTSTLLAIFLWALLTHFDVILVGSLFKVNLTPSIDNLLFPALIGIFADGIGFYAILKLIDLAGSVKVGIAKGLATVVGVFLATILLRETLSIYILLGLVLTLIALLLSTKEEEMMFDQG